MINISNHARAHTWPYTFELGSLTFSADFRNPRFVRSFQQVQVGVPTLALMPMDIMFEIFKHLHPLDLLHLARTSQALRNTLMSRTSRCVWRITLSSVIGLPFCPSDLSEPQYASLAFDDHCHFCSARNVHQIYWVCRVRCCNRCLDKKFVIGSVLDQCFPTCLDLYRRNAIFPYIVHPKRRREISRDRILYYRPTVDRYIGELASISWSESAVMRWSSQKKLELDARIKHAKLCETWNPPYWGFQQSSDMNFLIIPILILLLAFIWREKITDLFAPSPPIFLQ